jgi:hypothetical protein
MRVKSMMLAAAGLLLAGPALAQTTTGGDNDATGNDNIQVSDVLDLFVVDNAPDSYSSTSSWSLSKSYSSTNDGNTALIVTANQSLKGINTNSQMDELIDLDGEDDTETAVGYNSGSNSINDNAFAAFAGISNNAWNTGVNNNTQAATNIAAYGQVSFGVSGCCVDDGTGGGDGGGD